MKAATAARREARLFVAGSHAVDGRTGNVDEADFADALDVANLPSLLSPGDLLVVNDAATLPASLAGRTGTGDAVELRLLGLPRGDAWPALLFGAGDWRTQTEERPRPPSVATGDTLTFAGGLHADVARVWPESPRLVDVRFDRAGAPLLAALYAQGRPVQYAYLPDALAIGAFQTPFAARPWAMEMPSAGRGLTPSVLSALRRAQVGVASLTHAAGLSSTGEPALDALLPLPEAYEIPPGTAGAVNAARARGGRVVAAGTTVVRALESAATSEGITAGRDVARLRIARGHRLRVVDAVLTGMHEPGSSHFDLLTAFAPPERLAAAHARAEALGFLAHEFGDAMLVWRGGARDGARDPRAEA